MAGVRSTNNSRGKIIENMIIRPPTQGTGIPCHLRPPGESIILNLNPMKQNSGVHRRVSRRAMKPPVIPSKSMDYYPFPQTGTLPGYPRSLIGWAMRQFRKRICPWTPSPKQRRIAGIGERLSREQMSKMRTLPPVSTDSQVIACYTPQQEIVNDSAKNNLTIFRDNSYDGDHMDI